MPPFWKCSQISPDDKNKSKENDKKDENSDENKLIKQKSDNSVIVKIQGNNELNKIEEDGENSKKKEVVVDSTTDSSTEKTAKLICENCDLCVNCQKVMKIFFKFIEI